MLAKKTCLGVNIKRDLFLVCLVLSFCHVSRTGCTQLAARCAYRTCAANSCLVLHARCGSAHNSGQFLQIVFLIVWHKLLLDWKQLVRLVQALSSTYKGCWVQEFKTKSDTIIIFFAVSSFGVWRCDTWTQNRNLGTRWSGGSFKWGEFTAGITRFTCSFVLRKIIWWSCSSSQSVANNPALIPSPSDTSHFNYFHIHRLRLFNTYFYD